MSESNVSEQLTHLRIAISEVDRALLELIRRRMELAGEVGRVKAAAGQPIVVPEVHGQVLTRAREHAEVCGVSEDVMEAIFDAVTRGSVERQHRVGIELRTEVGEPILILGGAGNMGAWFSRFAHLLGHQVDIVDPAMLRLAPAPGRFGTLAEIEDLDRYRAILVAVPLRTTVGVIEELIERKPRCAVIEIASIKDHLTPALERASEAGLTISSLHPMFGPRKSPYEPLTFLLAYRSDPVAEKSRVEGWLRHPYTHLIPVPFDHHDQLMGWLLGFAHLSGMLFGCAVAQSGLSAEELTVCASTSYKRQSAAAAHVLAEDPDLYYDIQRLNPNRERVYEIAQKALGQLVAAVERDDREGFREILTNARHHLVVER